MLFHGHMYVLIQNKSWHYCDAITNVNFLIWKHLDPVAKNVSDYLHDFSVVFMEAGQWEESYSTVDGAIILHQRLATYQTTDFNKDLVLSLTLLHVVQVKLGYREEGLEAISEVVALY